MVELLQVLPADCGVILQIVIEAPREGIDDVGQDTLVSSTDVGCSLDRRRG